MIIEDIIEECTFEDIDAVPISIRFSLSDLFLKAPINNSVTCYFGADETFFLFMAVRKDDCLIDLKRTMKVTDNKKDLFVRYCNEIEGRCTLANLERWI